MKKYDYNRLIKVIIKRYGIYTLVSHPFYKTRKGYRTKVQKKFIEHFGT